MSPAQVEVIPVSTLISTTPWPVLVAEREKYHVAMRNHQIAVRFERTELIASRGAECEAIAARLDILEAAYAEAYWKAAEMEDAEFDATEAASVA
jgi:hypothetical protein